MPAPACTCTRHSRRGGACELSYSAALEFVGTTIVRSASATSMAPENETWP